MALKDLAYKPRTATVRVVLDDTLRLEAEEARKALAVQRRVESVDGQGLGSKIPEFEAAVADADARADAAAVSFIFQAIPRHELARLVAESPPTPEELDGWREQATRSVLAGGAPNWSVRTFPPKLIAASLVEPETSAGEVQELWDEGGWSEAIWNRLWDAAWSVNQEASTRPT